MTIADYLEDRLLNLVLQNTTFGAVVTVWGSLHTADPGETGTGSPLASTPRVSIAFNAAASATSVNSAVVEWTAGATGTVSFIGLWDGSSTGTANHLWSGALTASKVVANASDIVRLTSGSLAVSLA